MMALPRPVPLRAGHFSADVARARTLTHGATAFDSQRDAPVRGFTCAAADWGTGTFVPVRYAGHRGVLAFRAVNGDTQVVDLYGCGSSQVLRSITLPAP